MAAATLSELRVVQLIPSLGVTGGLERVATSLAVGLAPHLGRLVVCYSRPGPFEQPLRDAGIHLERIHRPKPKADRMLRSSLGLARVLVRERPQLIHAHNAAASVSAAIARPLAFLSRAPIVATFHGPQFASEQKAARALDLSADLVVGVSTGISDWLKVRDMPASRLATVFNAVDPQPNRSEQEVRDEFDAHGVPLLVTIGRYVREKNQALLLEALTYLRERGIAAKALIVGGGPLEETLRERVTAMGLEGVATVTGPREDAASLTAAADVFVLSSAMEGLPLVILEAMTLGRPVVSTSVGGIADAIDDGETGILIPPNDANALAGALERVLTDDELRAKIAAGGADYARRHFSVTSMVEQYCAVYRDALELPRSAWRIGPSRS